MANPNQVVGQVTVIVDGQKLPTSGESTLEIGGVTREPVIGDYDASAFRETPMPSKADVTLLNNGKVSLSALRAIDNATLILKTDTGRSWVVRHAYVSEPPSFGQDGKAKVVFQGPPAEEML